MKNFRKIISEEFSNLLKNNKMSDLIKSKFDFLKDFVLFDEKNEAGKQTWRFLYRAAEYKIVFRVFKQNEQWGSKYNVYWKNYTKEFTHAVGKDCEFNFGPYKSLEKMAVDVDRKMHNSPNRGPHLYDDDYNLAMDYQIVDFLKKLKENGNDLEKLSDVYFDDLKKIYDKVKNTPEDKLLSFSKREFEHTEDKQDALLDLQKVQRIPYYNSMHHVHLKK